MGGSSAASSGLSRSGLLVLAVLAIGGVVGLGSLGGFFGGSVTTTPGGAGTTRPGLRGSDASSDHASHRTIAAVGLVWPAISAGEAGQFEKAAVAGWRLLAPWVQVVVYTRSPDVADAATALQVPHVANAEVDQYGVPLVSFVMQDLTTRFADTLFIGMAHPNILVHGNLVQSLQAVATGAASGLISAKSFLCVRSTLTTAKPNLVSVQQAVKDLSVLSSALSAVAAGDSKLDDDDHYDMFLVSIGAVKPNGWPMVGFSGPSVTGSLAHLAFRSLDVVELTSTVVAYRVVPSPDQAHPNVVPPNMSAATLHTTFQARQVGIGPVDYDIALATRKPAATAAKKPVGTPPAVVQQPIVQPITTQPPVQQPPVQQPPVQQPPVQQPPVQQPPVQQPPVDPSGVVMAKPPPMPVVAPDHDHTHDHQHEAGPPVVTMFTTPFAAPRGSQKWWIQYNAVKALTFIPRVEVVVFSKEPAVAEMFKDLNVEVVKDFPTNPYGTPYLAGMFKHVEHHGSSRMFGYMNADILFCHELLHTLEAILKEVDAGRLKQHVLMSPESLDRQVKNAALTGHLFQTDAEDYFVITPGTFNWNEMPEFVIGRPGYDNYLVDYAFHRPHRISSVDATRTVHAVHQTGSDGNLAGHKERPDKLWNIQRGEDKFDNGQTHDCQWETQWHGDQVSLFKRRDA